MDANSCEAVAMQTSVWTPSRNDKRNPAPVDMEEGKSSFCFLWCIQYRNWCKISDNNRMILKVSNWYMILATNRNLWHVRLLAHQMGFLRDRHWDRSSCIWLSGREIDMQYKYIYVSIDIYIYISIDIYIYTWLGNHMLPPGYGAQMILIFHSLGPRHFLLCIYICSFDAFFLGGKQLEVRVFTLVRWVGRRNATGSRYRKNGTKWHSHYHLHWCGTMDAWKKFVSN